MSIFIGFLQRMVRGGYHQSALRCNDWSGLRVAALRPRVLLDVGCGDASLLFRYLQHTPEQFCGIEASPELRKKAEARGVKISSIDLNGRWPFPDNTFDVVHSAQVIEHLHNTRMFVQELFRVLKPGGAALVSSENLTSFMNLGAMALGYTPFTLMQVCGWYLGNPLGLHYQGELGEGVPIDDPAFAGVTGHVRALSAIQAQELFDRIGFVTKVTSTGLMPIPDWLGKRIESWMPRRGHFLLIDAKKPAASPQAAKPS